MDLISVIVPVYKVEKYLDRCVQSIVDQTYRNLEIILVDDGSPDNCGAMCDAWAEKDPRIKVIHKANGGLSDARNAGMAVATGEYMGFVDGDDYLAPEMYQMLFDRIREDGSDIAVCGIKMIFEGGAPSQMLTRDGCCILETQEAMVAIIQETWLKQTVPNKLYKTSLVWDINFPVGKCHEDVFWSYQAIARAGQVSVFDTPCYFYWQRAQSIMGKGFSLSRLDGLEAKLQRLEFIEQHFRSLAGIAKKDLNFSCLYCGQMAFIHLNKNDREKAVSAVKALRKKAIMSGTEKKQLPIKQRLWVEFSEIFFEGTCWLRNLLRIGI